MLKNKYTKQIKKRLPFGKLLAMVWSVFFLVISFLFICTSKKETYVCYHSSQLQKMIIYNENSEIIEYVDNNDRLTMTADLGYAKMIVTEKDGHYLEKYFDDKNKPIKRSAGYYAVLREYDENGNNTRNTYLDLDNNPIMTLSGYAIQDREYNDNNQIVVLKYLDEEGNPICTDSYGYERIYEYDENGNNNRITYGDASGNPMITGQGYASVYRCFYESGEFTGKVESEYYCDEKGNPIGLSLGQYGVHKEYDEYGREAVLTYLDANGQPIVTNKGYTTVKRTFLSNNRIETERYFDLDGNPYSLSEGQYGVKNEDGNTIYLNKNGEETFNLRMFLYNQSWIVIPLVVFVIFLSAMSDKKSNYFFLLLSVISIIYFTLLFREAEGTRINEFLSYYKRIFTDNEARSDILKNIWLFIPLGAILYKLYLRKSILLIPIAFSIVIELIQLTSGIGICELDDVISNSLGGLIGYLSGKLTTDIVLRIKSWKHIHIA